MLNYHNCLLNKYFQVLHIKFADSISWSCMNMNSGGQAFGCGLFCFWKTVGSVNYLV